VKILERVQSDSREALKAGDRGRAAALRMVVDALQQDAKLGKGDEVAVLQRERKRRLEAAEAYREGGRAEQADAEESEARLIEAYMPEQLSEVEVEALVRAVIGEVGAHGPRDMGKVMGYLAPRTRGRADGKRVSELAAQALASADLTAHAEKAH
jgi:uncharacterized protein YqeY